MIYDVVLLKQTCFACPSQWDVYTLQGIRGYIRYRWGYLSVDIWRDNTNLEGERVFGKQLGNGLDGLLHESNMKEEVSHLFNFEGLNG